MPDKINHIEAYILAGGKSSRMGTDKGLILFHGKPLIERIIYELNPLFERIVIVSNNPVYKKFDIEVIKDLIQDAGPAGGIHAAFCHSQTEKIFIVSCDMPFISAEAVQYILERSGDGQISVPFYEGSIQPLFGVYAVDCLQQWENLIALGMNKLRQMITYFDLSKIDVDENRLFSEILFMNVNDKKDLTKAIQQL